MTAFDPFGQLVLRLCGASGCAIRPNGVKLRPTHTPHGCNQMAAYSSGPPRRPPPPAKPIRPLNSLAVDLDLSEPGQGDEGDWIDSTFELRSGLTVIEHPIDTLPGELQDAFKKQTR